MSGDPFQPIFIAGPTAVGKSAIALDLAERLGAEIISVDSMQVYRGLDIGTAKPTAAERRGVPHHMIDVVDLSDSFDAAQFVKLAKEAEANVRSRRRIPLFCGGTGLYFKAYFEGVGHAPTPDPQLRLKLEQMPLSELLEELRASDPQAFSKIDQDNPRRVVRAVEAIRLSGQRFSDQQSEWNKATSHTNFFALSREPDDLRSRIDSRVVRMFADGIISETQSLMQQGLEQNRTAMQAIGYRQVVEHLNGLRSLEETVELIKTKTWHLARRQMTWLRNQLKPTWISVPRESEAGMIADLICANLEP